MVFLFINKFLALALSKLSVAFLKKKKWDGCEEMVMENLSVQSSGAAVFFNFRSTGTKDHLIVLCSFILLPVA